MTAQLPEVPTAEPTTREGRRTPSRLALARDYGIVVGFVVLFAYLSLASPVFLTAPNIKNLIDQSVAVGIIACAGTLVIISGGFDLSAGAIFAVTAVIGAGVTNSVGAGAGIAASLAAGVILGLINGLLCTVGRINDFVATLGTSIVFAGIATTISQGSLIIIGSEAFSALAGTKILGINSSTIIFLSIAIISAALLNGTVFGRHIFATGGNYRAARLSGVPVATTRIATYVLSGAAAAMAGLIVASRTMSVNANTGSGIIFDALAAILIGGNSALGGSGAIWRTVVGVLILSTIGNGFTLLGIDPLYQKMVTGIIIIVAVGVDAWARRRQD